MGYHAPMTRDTSPRRRPALFPVTAAALLLASWALTHWSELTAGPDLVLRFVLTGVFALLIALRPKPPVPTPAAHRTWPCLLLAAAGAALVGVGLVFRVRQAEWTGVLLLTGACLRAGLGPAAG